MNFTRDQIQNAISKLGFRTNNIINDDWLQILCPNPSHSDKHYGNAGIHLDTGKINCFACGLNISLAKFLVTYHHMTYKQVNEFVTGFSFQQSDTSYVPQQQPPKEKKEKIIQLDYDFSFIPLDPEKYHYTKQRGFTKQFCEEFNIVHCISGIYENYFIIPIQDKEKNIFIYEARRLKEYEVICKYFGVEKVNSKRMKKRFDLFIQDNGLFLNSEKQVADKDNKIWYDNDLKYLLQRKVLYPYGTDPNLTIWNIDNLDRKKVLYIVEGFGSIPKIYQYVSKNCSCLFGSQIGNSQLKYLQQFEYIIYIPDNDPAGIASVTVLHNALKDLLIVDIDIKDTDDKYVDTIINTSPIPSDKFMTKYKMKDKKEQLF